MVKYMRNTCLFSVPKAVIVADKTMGRRLEKYYLFCNTAVSNSRDFILTGVGPCECILNAASMISLILRKN